MPISIENQAGDGSKHELDITSLVFHNNKLYSGADDGKIKVWEEKLQLCGEVQAHPCSIFSLAVGNDTLYSCSNDGSVKAWSLENLKEKGTILQEQNEMWKVCFNGGKLYVGDDAGVVKIFENDKIVGVLEIMHPITDLLAINDLVYTARDLYVIISEVHPEQKKIGTLRAIEGRAPVCVIGDKLCFPTRSGKDIMVCENTKKSEFNEIGLVQNAHELIINATCGVQLNNENFLLTGGWDKVVKRWKVVDGNPLLQDSCAVEKPITSITSGTSGRVYVGGGDGYLISLNIQ